MKKKLLLILSMVIMVACLFVITASALTITDIDGVDREVKIYDDAPSRTNITVSTSDVIVFDDGFATLSAYVVKDSTTFGLKGNAYDFSFINGKTGKTYAYENIVELDIPQGVTEISTSAFASNKVIERASFPDSVTTLGGTIFEFCDSLRQCTFEHEENDGLTVIPNWLFANCISLEAICFPDCVTSFTGNTQLGGCANLTAIYLPKKLISTEGGNNGNGTFGNLPKAYFVNERFTYDNIPAKPDVYYFPAGYKSITGEAFDTSTNLNKVLVFPADNVTFDNGWTFEKSACDSNGTKPIIVFTGNVTSVSVGSWNVQSIYFANENDIDATSAGVSGSKTIYYCNAVGNTAHLVEPKATVSIDATCETNRIDTEYCFCGAQVGAPKTIEGTALGHNYVSIESITYEDYSKTGVKVCSCTNDNCDMTENQDALAIFTVKGYSVPVDKARAGISFRYEVNNEALAEYNTVNTALKFGVVGILEAYTGGNELLTKDGEKNSAITKNMILADLTNGGAKTVDFVITGSASLWETKQMIGENEISLKDAGIIMACYVCNGTDVQYIQTDGKVATPTGITYTTVNASTNE